jgi:hypothetical protein
LLFVKHHPETPRNPKELKKNFRYLRNEIFKKVGKAQRTAFDKDRTRFIKEYGTHIGKEKAAEIYDKSFVSNLLYEVGLNGFKGGIKDVPTILKKGFIKSATDYNKRAQIWFTNGYRSDPEAVTKISSKLKKGKPDIIDGKLNILLVKDRGEDKNHPLGTINEKWYETGDGPVYGRSDVITALNRQAGLPEDGGVNKSFIVSPDSKLGALLGKYMIHPVTPAMEKYMLTKKIHLVIPDSRS